MTSKGSGKASVRRSRPPSMDAGDVLDHFVSGFEWTVPTRIDVMGFGWLEEKPGELAGDEILWFSSSAPQRQVHAGPGLLEDFLKLASASDQAILAYARRWGPLWLCSEHNLPWRHHPGCEPSVSDWTPDDDDERVVEFEDNAGHRRDPVPEEDAWFEEPLSSWRDFSSQARATVRLARRLHDRQLGPNADWDALPFLPRILARLLHPSLPDPFATLADFPNVAELERFDAQRKADSVQAQSSLDSDPSLNESAEPTEPESSDVRYRRILLAMGRSRLEKSIDFQRQVFGEVMNYWLDLAGVQPRLDWTTEKPAVQLGGDGLIGAIAVQLLFDCSRTDGLAVCTSCGTPFLPGPRRPRRDRNVYCSDCGLKAASRDAAARYRQTDKYKATYRKWVQQRDGSQSN